MISNADQIQEQKIVPQVAVITVTEQAALIRKLVGFVFSPQTQVLSSQVAAVVTSDRLGMGHRVSKGDVIVKLDDREANAKYALAEAELMSARIRIKQKQLTFSRVENTYNKKLSSRAEFDEADLALQQTKNELLAYEAKSLLAKLNVEKHNIIAPFDAVLVTNSPVVGKQFLPGEKIVEILNKNQLRIKISLSKLELQQLQSGQAKLVLQGRESFPLKLLQSSPATLSGSGMIETEFSLPMDIDTDVNKNGVINETAKADYNDTFYSGQAVKLQLIEDRMSVPEHAISEDDNGQYVLTVSDDKVARVAINDLVVGQKVVVLGPNNLLPGDGVTTLSVGGVM
jgi:RND family efflux transporter MFP subunit